MKYFKDNWEHGDIQAISRLSGISYHHLRRVLLLEKTPSVTSAKKIADACVKRRLNIKAVNLLLPETNPNQLLPYVYKTPSTET